MRALIQAGLLQEKDTFTHASRKLNFYRSTKDPSVKCEYNINRLLTEILDRLQNPKLLIGGRRKTRKRNKKPTEI